ncbi:hypothetical protein J3S22_11300 [Corynebacterium aurimucosum]|nr:hypothetical protein J3S22_11300 [Corynebacterium aurimucosum]
MPRYSEQFKRDAVALYENNEAAPASVSAQKACATRHRRRLILSGSASETKEVSKLREERDILRKAAKYFA